MATRGPSVFFIVLHGPSILRTGRFLFCPLSFPLTAMSLAFF